MLLFLRKLLKLATKPEPVRGDSDFASLAEGTSTYSSDQIREGVVVENTEGERRKAKYVSQSYLLRDNA